jgi:dephospho-CoA kinase
MIHIGLTGGIASGKTTIARLFRYHNIPCFDADMTVHELYKTPEVISRVAAIFPTSIVNHAVCRQTLSSLLRDTPDAIKTLNALIHPLVQQKEREFRAYHFRLSTPIILTDIPLMLETKAMHRYDVRLMTYAPLWLRKRRAFARNSTMHEAKWQMILSKQASDAERRKHVHGAINTGLNHAHNMAQVIYWINTLRGETHGT